MSGGQPEIRRDDDYLATGTHDGADGASVLQDTSADFIGNGISGDVGQAIFNDTQSTSGNVTASTEKTCTDDTNSWDNGDTYFIYVTSTYNSVISSFWTDRSRGWKSDKRKLDRGWRPEDVDIDRDDPNTWGPGQPERR